MIVFSIPFIRRKRNPVAKFSFPGYDKVRKNKEIPNDEEETV